MAAAGPGAGPDFLYQRGQNDESDAWDDSVLIKAYDDAVSAMKTKLAEQNPEFSPKVPNKLKKKKRARGKQKKKTKDVTNQGSALKWSEGDACQAIYTEDGEVYDATIVSIDEEDGTCIVQYTEYGNEEEQDLENLALPSGPLSPQEQLTDTASEAESIPNKPSAQESFSNKQRTKSNSSSNKHSQKRQRQQQSFPWFNAPPPHPSFPFRAMPPPPPPPPNFPPFQVPGYQASGPSLPMPPVFPSIPPPPPPFPDRGSGDENEALYSMLISWYMSGYHTGYYQGLKHSTQSAHGAHR